MPNHTWDVWIDVGGTFTDCIARSPTGEIRRHKLLSSGATKGKVDSGSTRYAVVSSSRRDDPPDFWARATLSMLDGSGALVEECRVASSKGGTLELESPLPYVPAPGTDYELYTGQEAPIVGIRFMLGLRSDEIVPSLRLRLGTTRGTNALLTRTGARTALAVTQGFGDLLEIGYQDRPRLFDLTVRNPRPLTELVVEIRERMSAAGEVLTAPDAKIIREQLIDMRRRGAQSLAICLLHADLYPSHEMLVETIARDIGFTEISRSSAVAPIVKIVPRAETAVVDAYLNPVLRHYVASLEAQLPGSQIRVMTSSGGLVSADAFRGCHSVLSGPAGGVVGYARAAEAAGRSRAIGFDMGGTSTDVSCYDGQFELEYESHKAGVRLVTPTLAIDTVAAGGGSICRFDGIKLVVGPESAGADPGPACYGRGGPLCVTDLNLFLGRVVPDRFPFELDRSAVARRLDELAAQVLAATRERATPQSLAEGLIRIANANMASAIKNVSIARGRDPQEHLLVAFGGAAGQHACAVAEELGVREILFHPDASLLSAHGVGLADVTRHAVLGLYCLESDIADDALGAHFTELASQPLAELAEEGFPSNSVKLVRTIDMRYQGVDATISVPLAGREARRREFERAHQQLFGYLQADRPIELVALRVAAIGRGNHPEVRSDRVPQVQVAARGKKAAVFGGREEQVAVYDRNQLAPGSSLEGPALVADPHSIVVLEPGWRGEILSGGELLASRTGNAAKAQAGAPAAVQLELFNNMFAGVAERMGQSLRRTAISVNVKERLDFSCAIFTAEGALVANAPHIPVHLGAMGATVRALLADNPRMQPGDVFATNDPYRGGSHLPDVTVVMPVFDERGQRIFFTASRAHHAEIGGARPGSMPPSSRRLGEEGVVISNFQLVCEGRLQESELRELLTARPYPSRNPDVNLADLRAQVAAVQQGARDLQDLVERYGLDLLCQQMQDIQLAAETKVRQGLAQLPAGEHKFVDYLDLPDGTTAPIAVQITLRRNAHRPAAVIDFTGTGPVVNGNLNATPAIVSAAILYVLRLLVNEDIPLNEGALRAVEIVLPPSLLNPAPGETPAQSPAVAAGNVETSQRVVDVLLGALGIAAASQGTMNNLLFGGPDFGYYETICGGSGATADGPGADAVQVHMTNTRATDPEVLERRLPVRLWEFSVRRGSGGPGRHRGGDGAVKRIEFLERLELSLITQRRGHHPPFGLAGGSAGAAGENYLLRSNGSLEPLAGIVECTVSPGDKLLIRTPGGGGFGPA